VRSSALSFLEGGQDADAGWSYFPNTNATPGVSDPNSTSYVMQALMALGLSPTSATFTVQGANPVSNLLSFQLGSGPSSGAFFFPPAPAPASLLATYQAVPPLMGLALPFGASGRGYWLARNDGDVFPFGDAVSYGTLPSKGVHVTDIKTVVSSPTGKGYWLAGSDGGVFAFGDAGFFGSTGAIHLNQPVVGMAATPDGRGYWLVASDGGVFAFGDAGFFGSTGAIHLNQPVVGMAVTPDGAGYWLVASDGGVFAFGDAGFHGSTGAIKLNQPVVGMAATPDGMGYRMAASDGGVFAFGDVPAGVAYMLSQEVRDIVGIASSPARPA
jgi:hypothetical protein